MENANKPTEPIEVAKPAQEVRRRPYAGRKSIKTAILENFLRASPLSIPELAASIQVSVNSVHQRMSQLRQRGLIPQAPIRRRKGAEVFEATITHPPNHQLDVPGATADHLPSEPTTGRTHALPADLEPYAPDGIDYSKVRIADELARMQRLSYIFWNAPDQIAIQASKALEDMGKAKAGTVGPPAPLTEEAKIARLSRIMMAVGRELSEKAAEVAFRPPAPEQETPKEVEEAVAQAENTETTPQSP